MKTAIGIGQSVMVGNRTGGDTSVDSRVKFWNGSALVTGEIDVFPISSTTSGANNILLQFGRQIALDDNEDVLCVLSAVGGTPIDNFILGGTSPDMFSDAVTQYEDMLADQSLPNDTPLDYLLVAVGESNNNDTGLFQFADKIKALIEGYKTKDWFTPNTKVIMRMLCHNRTGDRANNGIRVLATEGYPNFYVINTEFDETDDGQHPTGPGLTENGQKMSWAARNTYIWIPKRIIDRDLTVDVLAEFSDLYHYVEWLGSWEFASRGSITSLITDDVTLDKSLEWHGPYGDRILWKGELQTGKTDAPGISDLSATYSTSKTTVEGWYKYRIYVTGAAAWILSGPSCLKLESLPIIGNGTSAAIGIDARDQTQKIGGANIGLDSCVIMGFNGTNGYGIRSNGGFLRESNATRNTFIHNKRGVFVEGTKTEFNNFHAGWNEYGIFADKGARLDIPVCHVQNNTIDGVYMINHSTGTVASGTISGNTSKDIRCLKGSSCYVDGATYTNISPAVTTDPNGTNIVKA